jgi:hypothetical protein
LQEGLVVWRMCEHICVNEDVEGCCEGWDRDTCLLLNNNGAFSRYKYL